MRQIAAGHSGLLDRSTRNGAVEGMSNPLPRADFKPASLHVKHPREEAADFSRKASVGLIKPDDSGSLRSPISRAISRDPGRGARWKTCRVGRSFGPFASQLTGQLQLAANGRRPRRFASVSHPRRSTCGIAFGKTANQYATAIPDAKTGRLVDPQRRAVGFIHGQHEPFARRGAAQHPLRVPDHL